MKLLPRLFACLLFTSSVALAQTAVGSISGRVLDSAARSPVAGARVTLDATGELASTDALGAFEFRSAPSGPQSITVSYLGFPEEKQTVAVVAGQTATALIALGRTPAGTGGALQLDSFVVEGIREGQARALNQQRTADNLKNIVAADAIGQFPDTNAAEAAMRLPGINVARDQGEGKLIGIRGFNSQLNNVTLNGVQAPSSRNAGREVALDLVPVDNIASIEITKSVTPDQDATALGGTVNITTKNAFSRGGRSIDASLRLGYNDLPQKWLYSGSVGFGDVYRGGDLGAFVSASYFNSERGSHSVQGVFNAATGPAVTTTPAPLVMTQANLIDNAVRRTRYGLTTDLDYKLSAETTAYLRFGYTRHNDQQITNTLQTNFAGALQPGFNADAGTFTGGALTRVVQFFTQRTGTLTVTGGGVTRRGNLTIDGYANLGYAFGITSPDSFNLSFRTTGVTSSYAIAEKYYPTFTSNVDRNDLTRFAFAGGIKTDQQNYQYDYNGAANVKLDRVFGALPGYLKLGAKLHRTDKEFDIENLSLTTYTGPGAPLTAAAFARSGTADFVDNRYAFGPRLDHSAAQKFLNDNISAFGVNAPATASSNSGDYLARETVNALYGMASFDPWPKLRVIAGVRAEFTAASCVRITTTMVSPACSAPASIARPAKPNGSMRPAAFFATASSPANCRTVAGSISITPRFNTTPSSARRSPSSCSRCGRRRHRTPPKSPRCRPVSAPHSTTWPPSSRPSAPTMPGRLFPSKRSSPAPSPSVPIRSGTARLTSPSTTLPVPHLRPNSPRARIRSLSRSRPGFSIGRGATAAPPLPNFPRVSPRRPRPAR